MGLCDALHVTLLGEKLLRFQTRNTTSAWIHDKVTAFADDFLAMFRLRTVEDLSTMCVQIGCLFTALHEAGMQINLEKSQLLIHAAGSTLKRWINMRAKTVEGSKFVQLGTPFRPMPIRAVQRVDYLGVILSFGKFEQMTARHRIKCAGAAVTRLSRVLFAKQALSDFVSSSDCGST